MDRLTYKNNRGEWCIKSTSQCAIATCSNDNGKYYIGEPIDRLAEFENAIENGMLVRLPCFQILKNAPHFKYQVVSMNENGIHAERFIDKEEAEARFAELQNK